MVVVAVEFSRLLRRVLLVAAVAVGGWLLSAVFAGTAGADGRPDHDSRVHSGQSDGLLGSLVGGLTGTLGGVTDTVSGITDVLTGEPPDFPSPSVMPPAPVAEVPETLPAEVPVGEQTPERVDVPPAEMIFVPDAPTPAAAPPTAPEPVAPRVVAVPVVGIPVVVAPAPPAVQDPGLDAAEQATQGGGHERQPAKAPAAPAGTGISASTTHDGFGSARGPHGALPTQTVLHPAGAGYTTRSLAVDAAGRVAGLPASSPD